jgi:hypothetical protein
MGIQYVTVKVDTSGLYQPLSSATGVVGIIGPAPSAGTGFSNPTLFTRPLTGTSGEPYASVVRVLRVAAVTADVQTVSITITGNPTGGTFTLTVGGQTTAAIPYNAKASQVQSALSDPSMNIGADNVACGGGPLPGTDVTVTLQPWSLITWNDSGLTGGTPGTTPKLAVGHQGSGGPVNEVQLLSITGKPKDGSTFTLTFKGQATAAIPYKATVGQVQSALSGPSMNIGADDVVCGGGPLPDSPVTITFQDQLGCVAQPLIAVDPSKLTDATASVTRTTPGGVAKVVIPVDANNNDIPGLAWDPDRFTLYDTKNNAALSVDPNSLTLRYPGGGTFPANDKSAAIVVDLFSTVGKTATSTSKYWGVPLDVDGQPIANLLMRPDVAPAGAFTDFNATPLSVDGTLGVPGVGTGRPKGADGSIYYKVRFDICHLAKSINLALTNGALQVWGYATDPTQQPSDPTPGFTDFSNRQINIVCLSSDSIADDITLLKNHVDTASPNDAGGGGNRPRIGVAMLPMGGIPDKHGNLTNKFSDWKPGVDFASSRMVFVAANSPDDIASAAAGVIAGVDPWVSLILKPVSGIGINGDLSDEAIKIYLAPDQSNLTQPHVIPILHPDFLAGSGPVMGEGFTADPTGQRLYIDIVRTIDDIAFRLKSTLTSPQVIGTLRINRPGLRVLSAIVRGMLNDRVAAGEIDDFAIDIPIQALTEMDESQLNSAQQKQLAQVQNSRQLAFNVLVTYSGAIHQLVVTLKFI